MPYSEKEGGPIRFDELDTAEGYAPWPAYGQSKLANILLARELNKRLAGQPVLAAACHPGGIITELQRHQSGWSRNLILGLSPLFKSVAQGAATEVLLATAPGVKGGEYYADCNIFPSLHASHDAVLGQKLWEVSEKLCAV
eukprot:jgi/Chrzof1/3644/Cz13g03170.t1